MKNDSSEPQPQSHCEFHVKPQPQPETTVFGRAYADYYDLLYRDKDYRAEAEYVARLIRLYRPQAQSVLELGSGTGIHARFFAEQGFRVHGIERSPEMFSRSQTLAQRLKKDNSSSSLKFTAGDIRSVRLGKHFDAVIALFHVISYQTTNDDVEASFKTAREHLNQGGVFIFDVWYGPAVLTDRPAVRIKRMADDQIEVTRLAEPVLHPNENLVDVRYHVFVRDLQSGLVKELKETHVMRYFFGPEIELLASQLGFCVSHSEEWLTGKPLGSDTWGACFCFQGM